MSAQSKEPPTVKRPAAKPASGEPAPKTTQPPERVAQPAPEPRGIDSDDAVAAEKADEAQAAVAKPVTSEAVQVYGWKELVALNGVKEKLKAKLDTGARTCSIHAEDVELFERDGSKWVRFVVTDPTIREKPMRTRVEAPFVRIAKIKEPGGVPVEREVVKLSFRIGDRKLRGEFTLNNRKNMLAPVLIGRNMIKVLGWVDPSRTYIADQNIKR
ncbi:MAG: RimK/LysX family protein [Verrucomicrobiota bacterium]